MKYILLYFYCITVLILVCFVRYRPLSPCKGCLISYRNDDDDDDETVKYLVNIEVMLCMLELYSFGI